MNFSDNIVQKRHLTYRHYDEESKIGLKVSDEKTKSMQIMETSHNRLSIQNKQIEDTGAFANLGSVVSTEEGAEEDIKRRLFYFYLFKPLFTVGIQK